MTTSIPPRVDPNTPSLLVTRVTTVPRIFVSIYADVTRSAGQRRCAQKRSDENDTTSFDCTTFSTRNATNDDIEDIPEFSPSRHTENSPPLPATLLIAL